MAFSQPRPDTAPAASAQGESPPLPDFLQLEHLQFPPGEGRSYSKDCHTLFVNLSARPIHYQQTQDGRTHTGLYRHGDFTLTPADLPFFGRWQSTENCLMVQLSDRFLRSVAETTLTGGGDRILLQPTFQSRQSQISAIATLLLTELQQAQPGGTLCLDSLANVLAVELLRGYASHQLQLPDYEGGLPPYQLHRVLDYIDAQLTHNIKLADLAQLLNMSPFHFSRLFKQSTSVSPHQYLLQQRIERAKRLLREGDRPIIDIAFDCGFSSHSHLSKQFRQATGITPKAFRSQ